TPAAAPAEVAPPSSPAADGVRVNVSATEKTWLSLTADGKHQFSGVLEPSETKMVEGKESARLRVGNAGGVEVLWNGKSIGPLGGRGKICTVLFTKDKYQILPDDDDAL
ncbi:MAG: DUF4115 domain-containing protein, partial [Bryobacteraceae bacterium]